MSQIHIGTAHSSIKALLLSFEEHGLKTNTESLRSHFQNDEPKSAFSVGLLMLFFQATDRFGRPGAIDMRTLPASSACCSSEKPDELQTSIIHRSRLPDVSQVRFSFLFFSRS
jgi:hypothetical protein